MYTFNIGYDIILIEVIILSMGQNIKKYRKEKGITQNKLGEIIGKKEITIRKYESGDIPPSIEILKEIAKTLEIDVSKLLDTVSLYPDEIIKASSDYFLEQYIHTLGYEIIGDLEENNLFLKTKVGTYEIDMKGINDLKASSKSFIEYKLHEIINKSREMERS